MNTIAVLTDLSAETTNACFYALKLAVRMRADVQLFNVSITNKIKEPVLVATGDEAWGDHNDKAFADNFCNALYADFEHRCFTGAFKPMLSCQAVQQSAADALMSFMGNDDVGLIIVPLPGGQTMSSFGQSIAFKNIMRLATAPILVLPENADTQYFEKIAFCAGGEANDTQNILSLVGLMKPLSPSIMVASLTKHSAVNSIGKAIMKAVKERTDYGRIYYRDIMPVDHSGSWKWLTQNKKCDLLALTQKSKPEMDMFFNQGETYAATWHINIPLLVFPAWSE
ncbi:hypothetical protein C8P68_10358 [Mucilaginibacter yixingensis]|uniref:Nucleotide-binding universal stress UspA family protein n=1 Tax=Mucilaginibacter yixingensis TaxID=1295612 RepID=A0A2T5JAT6_9SPHI|nr:hypothetical protein [Mucilaginibacter yixingensis]PTQ97899.1 hypothetical protein C8P68_10358 [Mucilaginibacter yixingensis]